MKMAWVALACFCAGSAWAADCGKLKGMTVPAAQIGMPTTGAEVTSAHGRHTGAAAFCKVMGRVHPLDPKAEDIRFELNLPEQWNEKAVQFGGGDVRWISCGRGGTGAHGGGREGAYHPAGEWICHVRQR